MLFSGNSGVFSRLTAFPANPSLFQQTIFAGKTGRRKVFPLISMSYRQENYIVYLFNECYFPEIQEYFPDLPPSRQTQAYSNK